MRDKEENKVKSQQELKKNTEKILKEQQDRINKKKAELDDRERSIDRRVNEMKMKHDKQNERIKQGKIRRY